MRRLAIGGEIAMLRRLFVAIGMPAHNPFLGKLAISVRRSPIRVYDGSNMLESGAAL
jgi:hypothetical protein